MATKHPRLNVVLEPKLYSVIHRLADKEGLTLSTLARDLIKEALEVYEDRYWTVKAQERLKTFSAKKALSHEDVWKQ